MASGPFVIPSVFKAVDKMSRPVKRMSHNVGNFASKTTASFARADRAVNKFVPSLNSAGRQIMNFAKSAAIFTGLALLISITTGAVRDNEEAMASLSAITGVTGKNFVSFKNEVSKVAKETRKASPAVAKAFEIVGSQKPELLKSASALGEVTKASIVLSKATKDDLETSSKALTGTLNQFNLAASESNRVINVLAAGSQAGAAAVPLISESLKQFGAVAASMNVTVEDSVGLIETLAEKNIVGAEAGTKLRNVLTNMATIKALSPEALKQLNKFGVDLNIVSNKALPLEKRLTELSKIQNDATALVKVFGKENMVAGQILLQNVSKVSEYTKAVTGTNIAQQQANTNSNTLNNRMLELRNTFVNLVTGAGAAGDTLNVVKDLVVLLTNNLEAVITTVVVAAGVFVAWKAVLIASRAAVFAYNVVLGVSAALNGTLTKNVVASKVAMVAYRGIVVGATAVQWAWNAAMSANPIGLIIVGIGALIGLIVAVVKHWESWGQVVAIFMGPLGMVISAVQSFRRNWDMLKEAFKNGGILGALKAIGKVFLDALLAPLQKVLEIAGKIPGKLGRLASSGADKLRAFRSSMGVSVEGATRPYQTPVPVLSKTVTQNEITTQQIERTERNQLDLNINDPNGRTTVGRNTADIPITFKPTVGAF